MSSDNIPAPVAFLFGPWPFQNELVARALQGELGVDCRVLLHDCERLSGVLRLCGSVSAQPNLILIDVGVGGYPIDSRGVLAGPERPRCPVALMNLEPGTRVEKQALAAGYRGFFYKTDPLDLFLRGVNTVLAGQVWVSRAVLSQCLSGIDGVDTLGAAASANLSPRETEVLAMVARGATNEDVADVLSVSINTVRTHLYSIFRKLNVPSRLQAALWAAKNL
jgi:LuxR family transcriptional regulator, positive regulator of biofilm formation